MPDVSSSTHIHHAHTRKRKRILGHHTRSGYLESSFYFSAAILLFLLAKLLHVNLLAPALGAIGIIALTVSKILKFKAGYIISIVFVSAIPMVYIWHWVEIYFIAVLSAELLSNPKLFASVLSESLILTTMIWFYHRQLRAIKLNMSKKWFIKTSYLKIFKLLFYFQLFFVLFWALAFVLQKYQSFTRLDALDSAIIAGSLALLAAGIPAIIYLSTGSHDAKKSHLHSHHPGIDSAEKLINSDSDKK